MPKVGSRDPATVAPAADLVTTMADAPGCVGLQPTRLVSRNVSSVWMFLEAPKTRTHHGLFVLVNPLIEQSSRNEKAREGCLSVPDFTGDVKRATRLTVRGFVPLRPGGRHHDRRLRGPGDPTRSRSPDGLLFLDRCRWCACDSRAPDVSVGRLYLSSEALRLLAS